MRLVLAFGMLSMVCSTVPASEGPPPPIVASATPREIRAGDSIVDASFLTPYESRWKIHVTLADGRRRDDATWTDRLEVVEEGGRRLLRRTQHESESLADEEVHPGMAKKLGTDRLEITFINVFDPRTLAPIATTIETNIGRTIRLRFEGAHVTGEKLGWGGPDIAIDDRLAAPPFDFFDGMFGYLAAALPAGTEAAARLAAYRAPPGKESQGALGWLDLRGAGRERIVAGSFGQRDARVFDVGDGKGGSFRFWVGREPPYVLRVVQSEPAAGQTWTFELE